MRWSGRRKGFSKSSRQTLRGLLKGLRVVGLPGPRAVRRPRRGGEVVAGHHALDAQRPGWGPGPSHTVTRRATGRPQELRGTRRGGTAARARTCRTAACATEADAHPRPTRPQQSPPPRRSRHTARKPAAGMLALFLPNQPRGKRLQGQAQALLAFPRLRRGAQAVRGKPDWRNGKPSLHFFLLCLFPGASVWFRVLVNLLSHLDGFRMCPIHAGDHKWVVYCQSYESPGMRLTRPAAAALEWEKVAGKRDSARVLH